MTRISMLEFRRDAEGIISRVQRGQRMILTRRGKAVARLEPIVDEKPGADDPFYKLIELAESGDSLGNAEIDELLYGK